MIKQISIVGLVLTAGIITFTMWGNNDAEFIDDNHPRPRGDVSSMDYMNKVCHDSTNHKVQKSLKVEGGSLDGYCNCFASVAKDLKGDEEFHFALGYHILQRLDGEMSWLDRKSIKKVDKRGAAYLLKYKKDYGIPGREVILWGEGAIKLGHICFKDDSHHTNF